MKRLNLMLAFVLVASTLLACGGGKVPTPTPAVQPTEAKPPAAKPTEVEVAEAEPTPVPPTDTPVPPTPEVKPEVEKEELLANAGAAAEPPSQRTAITSLSFGKGEQQVDLMISKDEESGKTQIMVTSPARQKGSLSICQ